MGFDDDEITYTLDADPGFDDEPPIDRNDDWWADGWNDDFDDLLDEIDVTYVVNLPGTIFDHNGELVDNSTVELPSPTSPNTGT